MPGYPQATRKSTRQLRERRFRKSVAYGWSGQRIVPRRISWRSSSRTAFKWPFPASCSKALKTQNPNSCAESRLKAQDQACIGPRLGLTITYPQCSAAYSVHANGCQSWAGREAGRGARRRPLHQGGTGAVGDVLANFPRSALLERISQASARTQVRWIVRRGRAGRPIPAMSRRQSRLRAGE
jgi:hypothetical protein